MVSFSQVKRKPTNLRCGDESLAAGILTPYSKNYDYKILFYFQQFPIVSDISEYYNSGDRNISSYPIGKDDTTAMSAIDQLVKLLLDFTPEQLNQFLNDPVTVSILRPEEASVSCLQEAPSTN